MRKRNKCLPPILWSAILLCPISLFGQTTTQQRPVPGADFGSANVEPQSLPAGPPPAFSDPSLNDPNPPGQGLGTSFGSNSSLERASTEISPQAQEEQPAPIRPIQARPLENSALDPEGPPP